MDAVATSPSLLDRLRGPDRAAAWDRFARLYTPVLDRWAARLGVPAADRPDLLQDVFVSLLGALPAFTPDPGRSFRAWLYAVLANKWRDHARKRRPGPLADGSGGPAVPDPAAEYDEAEYRAVLVGRAARLIETDFRPEAWAAFRATAIDGRPAAEVAAELGMTANAVYLARARVLARLRQELAGLL